MPVATLSRQIETQFDRALKTAESFVAGLKTAERPVFGKTETPTGGASSGCLASNSAGTFSSTSCREAFTRPDTTGSGTPEAILVASVGESQKRGIHLGCLFGGRLQFQDDRPPGLDVGDRITW